MITDVVVILFNSFFFSTAQVPCKILIGKHCEEEFVGSITSPEAGLKFAERKDHGSSLRFLWGAEVHGLLPIGCSIFVFIMRP